MFDAYTQKKLLPRLVIALIAINASWFLTTAAIELGNIAAVSIQQLIMAPFGDFGGAIAGDTNTGGTLLVLGGGVLAAYFGAAALLVFWNLVGIGRYIAMLLGGLFLALMLALFASLAFVLVRQVALIALVVISPLAIAAWILPSTTSYFMMWRKYLVMFIMFYPIYKVFYTLLSLMALLLAQAG